MAKVHTQTKVTAVEVTGEVGKISALFERDPKFPEGVVLTLITPDGKVGGKIAIEESTFRIFKQQIDKL